MTSSECIAEGHFAVPMICEDVREVLEKLLTWSEVHWGTPRSMLKFVSVLFCCCCCCFGGFSGFEWRFCLPVQCLLLWRNSHIINVHIICFLKHIRFLVLQALTLSIRGVLRTVHLFCYELALPPPPPHWYYWFVLSSSESVKWYNYMCTVHEFAWYTTESLNNQIWCFFSLNLYISLGIYSRHQVCQMILCLVLRMMKTRCWLICFCLVEERTDLRPYTCTLPMERSVQGLSLFWVFFIVANILCIYTCLMWGLWII